MMPYWAGKQPWAKVTEKSHRQDPTRVAALLTGEVDAIDLPAIADLPRLQRQTLHAQQKACRLAHYIALDSARDVSPNVTARGRQAAHQKSAEGCPCAQSAVALPSTAPPCRAPDGRQCRARRATAADDVSRYQSESWPDAFDLAKARKRY